MLLILYDSKKRFLLQHRTPDAKLLPGYWAFFGGGLKNGETTAAALYREAFEELNYRPRAPQLVLEQDFNECKTNGRLYVYIEAFDGDKSMLKLHEGQGWGWFKESDIDKLKMVGRDRRIIRFINHYLTNNLMEESNYGHTGKGALSNSKRGKETDR